MVRILFHDLQIGTVSNSSGIFSGANKQWKYKHVSKQNQAFGTVSGKRCSISDLDIAVDDDDQIDSYSILKPQKL